MASQVYGTVGRNGDNRRDDVTTVQGLLTRRGYKPGRIDGICGRQTVSAIIAFQSSVLRHPDGLINVGGLTWNRLSADVPVNPPSKPASKKLQPTPQADGTDGLIRMLPKPDPASINVGLSGVSNAMMLELFGNPRETYSQEDQPITNEKLKRHVVIESVGPFRVYGLEPAVASLRSVMGDIQKEQAAVYPHITSAGMLVCRYQRGSTKAISNHSWGCAIDFKIRGHLDVRGDDKVQNGLMLIAPIFNRHGWYWGAGFRIEDGMHFEGGKDLVREWKATIG